MLYCSADQHYERFFDGRAVRMCFVLIPSAVECFFLLFGRVGYCILRDIHANAVEKRIQLGEDSKPVRPAHFRLISREWVIGQ